MRAEREESLGLAAQAREEADRVRADARRRLEEARAEVEILSRQKTEITGQLSHLSGVIEALAIPSEHKDHP